MKKFLTFIRTLHPRFWIMNYRYSKAWDIKLNELLDETTFDYESYDGYKIKLGDCYLWCANHPYASFVSEYNRSFKIRVRPSKKTILRIEDRIKAENLGVYEQIIL